MSEEMDPRKIELMYVTADMAATTAAALQEKDPQKRADLTREALVLCEQARRMCRELGVEESPNLTSGF